MSQEFWDRVFRDNDTGWVADHPPSYFFGILNLAGPFKQEFQAASMVLDVGPGRARLLEAANKEHVRRGAIEISDVNTVRLQEMGISVGAPASDVFDDGDVDLAWSVSCFPHCAPEMQRLLFAQVYRALRPGGVFYLEHVTLKQGRPEYAEEIKLPAGAYAVPPADIGGWWPRGSFFWIEREIGGDECPLLGWVARCVK